MREHPFKNIEQWTEILSSPILYLLATKNIKKGEEIFAHYPLPQGVERLKSALSISNTDTLQPIIEGTIALEGDENYSTISPTDEISDYSEGEMTDDRNDSTVTNSPHSSPTHQHSTRSERPIFQPDPDASEYINLLYLFNGFTPCQFGAY
jgi:hypothetical protein